LAPFGAFLEDVMDLRSMFGALTRRATAVAALLAVSVGIAAAAPAVVVAPTNLRQGPGTGFPVIATMPGGAEVLVGGCKTGSWCSVHWGNLNGYAIARNLNFGGAPVVAPAPIYAPPPVVVAPYPYPYYWGPRYYGPRYPRYYYGYRRWR
jgi:uncharacterized protein YraI